MEARELRLKVRELAEQLIAGINVPGGKGSVALPTTFVSQDDFDQTSSLGRFISEQLFHEFTQRGFPVREYRLASSLSVREDKGELLLSRDVAAISARNPDLFFVAGTYYADREAVFVNARLIRGADGMVLRTAQLIIPGSNNVVRRMLGGSGAGRGLAAGTLTVRDYTTATQPVNLTPIDLGEDIH
jgi:TolB-like protein